MMIMFDFVVLMESVFKIIFHLSIRFSKISLDEKKKIFKSFIISV